MWNFTRLISINDLFCIHFPQRRQQIEFSCRAQASWPWIIRVSMRLSWNIYFYTPHPGPGFVLHSFRFRNINRIVYTWEINNSINFAYWGFLALFFLFWETKRFFTLRIATTSLAVNMYFEWLWQKHRREQKKSANMKWKKNGKGRKKKAVVNLYREWRRKSHEKANNKCSREN